MRLSIDGVCIKLLTLSLRKAATRPSVLVSWSASLIPEWEGNFRKDVFENFCHAVPIAPANGGHRPPAYEGTGISLARGLAARPPVWPSRATSRCIKLQTPLLRTSICGDPSSQTCPDCSTTIRSTLRKVDSRCAIAMTVRLPIKRSNAWRTASSDSLSRAESPGTQQRFAAVQQVVGY